MKKGTKIFLWIIFGFLVVMLLTSVGMTPEIEASGSDVFLYKASGASLFFVWLVGVAIELDIFHIKSKIPLARSEKKVAHIGFWGIILVLSCTIFGVIYNNTSADFRTAMNEKSENINALETEQIATETEITSKEDIEEKKEQNKDTIIVDTDVNVVEPTHSDESSNLIEDETYDFDDAVYTVNGIEIIINSITLHRENKPEGYSLEVKYSLSNKNNTDATFEFSSQSGNSFILDDKKAELSTKAMWSQGHETSYHLKASENVEALIGDFNALSSVEGKTINGEKFEAIDIANIYTGQSLTVVLQINGIVDGDSEGMDISFEFNL